MIKSMQDQAWQRKINRGRYVERQILRWIRKHFDAEASIVDGFCPEKDITSKVLGDVEVKEDRMAHQTGNYAIEYEDGDGKPSGLAITKSKFFVLVDWEWVCYMATESLWFIVKSCEKKEVLMGEKFEGGTKSKGWLIPRDKILLSPLVTTQKRWFPVLQTYGN